MLPAPGFHHLHLNSVDPAAAIDFYTRQFSSTSASSWGGLPALASPNNVLLLFSKVATPPATTPQSAIWHFGWHGVCINGRPVPERGVEGLSLAHFPIRSINQFILRSILCRLAWSSRSDYNPSWGWHYGTFFKQLKVKPTISAADLTEAALLYVDIYIEPGQTPHQKVLVREPVTPTDCVSPIPATWRFCRRSWT